MTTELELASLADRVWLVWAQQGDYSDRTEWPICVAVDEETGEALVERLGQLWRELLIIYRRREDELDAAGDWSGETLFNSTPEGIEYKDLSGATSGLSDCYADDRAFHCCEVPIITAATLRARIQGKE